MLCRKDKLEEILDAFHLSIDALKTVAADFRYDLRKGLACPEESSLAMLRTYIGLPTGSERGAFLALDFGGTNVRASLVRLEGEGKYTVLKRAQRKLNAHICSKEGTAEELFGLLAQVIAEAAEGHTERLFLGHTFSFGTEQTNLYNARLIRWAKEFAVPGVEGEIVNDLLKTALRQKGLNRIEPVSVVNDTTATLLSAAYRRSGTYIAAIYATGFNTCYLERAVGKGEEPQILNLESGGFSRIFPNPFDVCLDSASADPGRQRLEKMVSGRYMGLLLGITLEEIFGRKVSAPFTAEDISEILADEAGNRILEICQAKMDISLDQGDGLAVQKLARAISTRSAKLVAAILAGNVWQLEESKEQYIAIDGSVYEKMPGVKETLDLALKAILEDDAAKAKVFLDKDGSTLGAAISAAIACKQ